MLKKILGLVVLFILFQTTLSVSPNDSFHGSIDTAGVDNNPAMQPQRVMTMSKKTYEQVPYENRYLLGSYE